MDELAPLLSKQQTAKILNVSTRHLERLHEVGSGPLRVKLGDRRFGYRPADIAAWVNARTAPAKHVG